MPCVGRATVLGDSQSFQRSGVDAQMPKPCVVSVDRSGTMEASPPIFNIRFQLRAMIVSSFRFFQRREMITHVGIFEANFKTHGKCGQTSVI